MAEFSPMMAKYLETKEQYKDCILFYRLGDFYEMFFEDAKIASKELELALTGKSCGMEERAPMCGVPHHAVDTYISRLIAKGYKVAICEQVEDPKLAKGIVKREVTRIVTPGTNTNIAELDESKNNFLMCVFYFNDSFGIANVDVTTGELSCSYVDSLSALYDEINRFSPSEIICNNTIYLCGIDKAMLFDQYHCVLNTIDDIYFDDEKGEKLICEHFNIISIDALGLKSGDINTQAVGALLMFLYDTQKNHMEHITKLRVFEKNSYMVLDGFTRRNLELTETMRERDRHGTFLWVLDKTKTAMGARKLRSFIEKPLLSEEEINRRLDTIEELKNDIFNREELREYMDSIYDLERIMGKLGYHSANPRDMLSLLNSIKILPAIKELLKDLNSPIITEIRENFDDLSDIAEKIEAMLDENPPLSLKEGSIIKSGYNEEIDRLRAAKTDGKNWLADLEAREKEKTGIKNLKIKYNRVFGYYYEVTNSFMSLVPDNWIRKQTLSNAERYTDEELKKLESDILGAEDKLFSLEYDLFVELRDEVLSQIIRIQNTAEDIALLDVYSDLAYVAEKNGYVRPTLNHKGSIVIKNGRHPVIEQMLKGGMFIENDTLLDNRENRIAIITGPNMAGKSTYMRQTALIVIMAQMGSFVPASEANIGITDRIFTRVGASDDLSSGQSTFMVEMSEVAYILKNATRNSLLILDEIGRGTSTYDGLSIAWAVTEYISDVKTLGAKTLFATHYHELTELEGKLYGVKNYCIAVREQGKTIQFLRKIIRGGADKSYGIQVARLAGVPEPVLERAEEIAAELTENDIIGQKMDNNEIFEAKSKSSKKSSGTSKGHEEIPDQMSLFETIEESVTRRIKELNVSELTPMDALNLLYKLQEQLNV